jgi:hypothetical protein
VRRRAHRQHVVAVHDHAGHVVGRRVRRDVRARVLHADGVVGGVLVVLADENDRELPHRRDVEGLLELALGGGAIAEEARGHIAPLLQLSGQRGATRDGQPAAHDAIGPQHPHGEVGDVHGPAPALAVPVDAAKQLGHHPPDVGPLGDAVPVATMGAGHPVAHGQGRAHPDRHRLLTHVGVHGAVDLAGDSERDGQLVELPDQDHGAQYASQLRCLDGHGDPLSGSVREHCTRPFIN